MEEKHDFLDASQDLEEHRKKKRPCKTSRVDTASILPKSKKSKRIEKTLHEDEKWKKKEKANSDMSEIIVVSSDEDDNCNDSDVILIEDSDSKDSNDICLRNRNHQKNLYACSEVRNTCSSGDEGEELMKYLVKTRKEDTELEASSSTPLQLDENDQNLEIVIFVKWKFCNTMKHTLRKFQPFESIFKYYAELENVPIAKICFETNAGKQIFPTMTPESIGLSKFDIVEGCVLTEATRQTEDDSVDDGKIEIKVQLREKRENISVRISLNDPLKKMMSQVAETLKVSFESLKFYFDGELVESNQTASDLDVEGGEIFDLKIEN